MEWVTETDTADYMTQDFGTVINVIKKMWIKWKDLWILPTFICKHHLNHIKFHEIKLLLYINMNMSCYTLQDIFMLIYNSN